MLIRTRKQVIFTAVLCTSLSIIACQREKTNHTNQSTSLDSSDSWDSDCKRVASNAVIGIHRAQRPQIQVNENCDDGALCITDVSLRSEANSLSTFRVTGEYFSGSFSYDVEIEKGADSCLIQKISFQGAD